MNRITKSLSNSDSARLFFGAHVEAPWPKDYPPGRMISEETRHITLAFLGNHSLPDLLKILSSAPKPPFMLGPGGIANELVFLPPEKSRVAALAVQWLDPLSEFNTYQSSFALWLKNNGYPLDQRPFFPHLTVARSPFDKQAWEKHFTPLPLFVKAIHLYQSMGDLEYKSLWELPLLPPFEEFEHTADIAFHVRGTSMQQLHQNAQLALAFKFPQLTLCFSQHLQNSLSEIIISLNQIVGEADRRFGCPFKAVSFHGNVRTDEKSLLHWEMIVDV